MSQSTTIKEQLTEDMKISMRNKNKERLEVVRLVLAAFKQIEVDERVVVDDDRALVILDKMLKERRDSIEQFKAASRDDLVAKESFQESIIREFLPPALSKEEIQQVIATAIAETGANSIKEMAKVVALVKPRVQGRADMAEVSKLIKTQLTG
jgi:uncharacterized protein